MTLRLPPDVKEALRATAARENRSMQAVAIDAIERYTSERTRRRDEILARILVEDKDLLDDLA
ncbi:MAG: hypothetical protein JJE50_03030 [Actinomycetales bacterium]|nr:hypothetical protein [Actinomycetales bacterium]